MNINNIINGTPYKKFINSYNELKEDFTKENADKFFNTYKDEPLSFILENSRLIFSEPYNGYNFYREVINSPTFCAFSKIENENEKVLDYFESNESKFSDMQKDNAEFRTQMTKDFADFKESMLKEFSDFKDNIRVELQAIHSEIADTRSELKAEIADLRSDVRVQTSRIDSLVHWNYWIIALFIAFFMMPSVIEGVRAVFSALTQGIASFFKRKNSE